MATLISSPLAIGDIFPVIDFRPHLKLVLLRHFHFVTADIFPPIKIGLTWLSSVTQNITLQDLSLQDQTTKAGEGEGASAGDSDTVQRNLRRATLAHG